MIADSVGGLIDRCSSSVLGIIALGFSKLTELYLAYCNFDDDFREFLSPLNAAEPGKNVLE